MTPLPTLKTQWPVANRKADVVPVDVPALYDVARESAGLVNGVGIRLTLELAGGKIVAVHVSPSVSVKDDKQAFWQALDRLLPTPPLSNVADQSLRTEKK